MKNYVVNSLLVAGGGLLGLLLAEFGVALLAPQQIWMATSPTSFFLRYDANLGWANREGVSGVDHPAKGVPSYRVKINSRGLRGPEVEPRKLPGVRRIAFLGDSNTFGFGIEEGGRFSDLLARMVPGIEALNCGVFGYGTDQEAIYLERQLLGFAPDMVVLAVSAGDLSDVMSSVNGGASKPFCRLIDGKFTLNNVPVPKSTPLLSSRALTSRTKVFLYRHSHLFRLVQARLLAMNRYMTDTVQEMDEREGFAVMVEIIRGMARVCRESGIDFKVLLISHGGWIEGGKRDRTVQIGYYGPLKQALTSTGIAVVDPTDSFVAWQGEPLFFTQDAVHLTPEGNRMLANILFRELKR
jgi:lysophospholipase L1-like esterase